MTEIDTPIAPRQVFSCNGPQFKALAEAGLTWLNTNKELVNSLNVFPIPDGDTGTNMTMTLQAAIRELNSSEERNVGRVAHALARGALMGARGNSGVILSQILRGFARSLDSFETFDAIQFANALREASETAYRGSVRPVEGTILTVIKDAAFAAEDAATRHRELRTLLERVVTAASNSVLRTPDLLPVLKQAGVVDSGGKGLAIILEGMLRYMRGLPLDQAVETAIQPLNLEAVGAALNTAEPGQEWEVIVDFTPADVIHLPTLYEKLEKMGTAIQVGEGDGMYRVHIHLLKSRRFSPLELAEQFGTITKVHMENLLAQLAGAQIQLPVAKVEAGQIGVVAVSPGDGLSQVLASLGAAAIVGGGQSQNPSTEDILRAVDGLPTESIVILPNNKNIILAARQVVDLSTKDVRVIPSRSVPQGVAALLQLVPNAQIDDVVAAMERVIGNVRTGEVTIATRTVELNGVDIQTGHYIGLNDGQIVVSAETLEACVNALVEHLLASAPEAEVLTLYHGIDLTPSAAQATVEHVRTDHPALTVDLHAGGQPHYFFIMSLE